MSFQLPPNPETQLLLEAETLAQDAVLVASQFDADVLARYKATYENYWKLGRDITGQQLQARSNRLGPTEIAILLKSGAFVQALLAMQAPLEEKYWSAPYDYSVVNVTFQDGHTESALPSLVEVYGLMQVHGLVTGGKIVLGEMRDAWLPPQPEEEPQPEESNPE
jgi:hypothetical protein